MGDVVDQTSILFMKGKGKGTFERERERLILTNATMSSTKRKT